MFTGIIKAVGVVDRIESREGDLSVSLNAPDLDWASFEPGESICVNGVCLTATEIMEQGFATDVSQETISVTTLAELDRGMRVNLEPAVAVGERLGGHLVSGHVDCIGVVRARRRDARSVRLEIEVPAEYRRYIAKKGSICVDGVSLTVNSVSAGAFGVNIIPHTAEVTIAGDYEIGSRVNVEVDLVARYLEALIATGDDAGLTKDFLRAHGYA